MTARRFIRSDVFKVIILTLVTLTCSMIAYAGSTGIVSALGMDGAVATLVDEFRSFLYDPAVTMKPAAPGPTESPLPGLFPTPGAWITRPLDLYGCSIDLPVDWTLQEKNRQAEPPVNPWGLQSTPIGHECVDYLVSSPDGQQNILLRMPCSIYRTRHLPCEKDPLILARLDDWRLIIREKSYLPGRTENVYAYQAGKISLVNGYLYCNYATRARIGFYLYYYDGPFGDFETADQIMISFLESMP